MSARAEGEKQVRGESRRGKADGRTDLADGSVFRTCGGFFSRAADSAILGFPSAASGRSGTGRPGLNSPGDIDQFLSLKSFAVVGASRDRDKYGNIVYRELRSRGFRVFAVNPMAREIEGDPCYPSLADMPEKVEGAVIIVPPEETERAVRAAITEGIRAVWMQPGAESREAIRACKENGLCTVHNACVLVELRRAFSSGGLDR